MKENVVLERITIDPHFKQRAQERTKAKTELDFKNLVRTIITEGTYIGETQAETGGRGHMFAQGKRAIILSLQLDVAITVINYTSSRFAPETSKSAHKKYEPSTSSRLPSFQGRLEMFYDSELKRLTKKEKQLKNQLEELQLKSAIDIAALNFKAFKTRSAGIKFRCIMQVNEINDALKKVIDELEGIITDKRLIAKARVSIS